MSGRIPALAVAAVLAAPVALADEESTCVTCHEVEISEPLAVPVPEWRDSVHAEHGVSCDGCHGGDPRLEDADASMSEMAAFRQAPTWRETSEHCGACHEAIAASFDAGRFGRLIAQGVRAPTCATCHMGDGHRMGPAAPEQILSPASGPGCPGCAGVPGDARWAARLSEVAGTETALLAAVEALEAAGVELSDAREEIRSLHGGFQRAVHGFEEAPMEAARRTLRAGARDWVPRLEAWRAEVDRRRRLGVAVIAALALLGAALVGLERSRR